jgi:hypothetical protein
MTRHHARHRSKTTVRHKQAVRSHKVSKVRELPVPLSISSTLPSCSDAMYCIWPRTVPSIVGFCDIVGI